MSEAPPYYAQHPMPAGWTAKRRADIQAHVDLRAEATVGEQRTMLIELLAQLAAAEAHATEAAAEAGKLRGLLVKAETEVAGLRDRLAQEQRVTSQQEGQMLALVQELGALKQGIAEDLGYLQDVCGAVSDSDLMEEISAAADRLGVKLVFPQPAAPAPVAPQQQEEDMDWERWFPVANSQPSSDLTVIVRAAPGQPKFAAHYRKEADTWFTTSGRKMATSEIAQWRYQAGK